MMNMGRTLLELSGPVLPARFDPVIRVLVRRWIVHAGKMKGLAPLDAGPAATAMESAALVARPGFGKGDFKPRALAHDVGFAHAQERRGEGDPRHPVQRVTLHRFKGFDESWAAVGIYEMVATVYRGRYRVGPFRRGDAEGDGEHDLLRIVPVRDRAAAGQRRSGEEAADRGDVHLVVGRHQARRATARVIQ